MTAGYEETTVNEIAAAAGVSHMTFFRYFATKEAVVIEDEYDAALVEAVAASPHEHPIDAISGGLLAALGEIGADELRMVRERTRLILATPALRERLWEHQRATQMMLAEALRDRGDADEFASRIVAGACLSTVTEAVTAWVEGGEDELLATHVERAFALLRREASRWTR